MCYVILAFLKLGRGSKNTGEWTEIIKQMFFFPWAFDNILVKTTEYYIFSNLQPTLTFLVVW